MTLISQPHNSRLDLDPWIGQRSATFKFELTNGATGEKLGEIHPIRTSVPTLTHDVTRTIKRTLSPISLGVADTALVNPVRDRVTVSMEIGGESYPLGRYVFTDQTKIRSTTGLESSNTLVDEMFIVDQKLQFAFSALKTRVSGSVSPIETVDRMMMRLVEKLPVVTRIEPTGYTSIGAWPQGTNRGQVLEDLSLDGDYLSPWLDHTSTLRAVRSFDPADRIPDFDWDANDVVIRDSITEVSDLLQAPNRIIVVSNGVGASDTSVAVTASYDIPVSAPHSITNRGFVVVDIKEMQITSAKQIFAIAQNVGQRSLITERVDLATPPDPRHDSHNVIRWQGMNWLEVGWSLPLVEGAEMRHVIRRAYR